MSVPSAMPNWHLHHMNALGKLDALVGPVEDAAANCYTRIAEVLEPPVVDILVQAVWQSSVIPDRGHVGYGNEDLVTLWLAPGHPKLDENLGEPLARTVAHEINHVLRFRSAGGTITLGDHLVCEGLAGRFVEQLFGNAPEPWECAVSPQDFAQYLPRAIASFDTPAGYRSEEISMHEWMFGSGDLPRWLGYTLGYEMVGACLRDRPKLRASDLISLPSADFKPALASLAS